MTPISRPQLTVKPKQRKCKVCRGLYEKRSMAHVVCGRECAEKYAAAKREKEQAKKARVERAETKKKLERLKTRSAWIKETQQAVNAYRREFCRIAGYTCICCDQPLDWTGNNVDAGHYRSVGSAPHMRFTDTNIWAQRKQCNRYGAGRAVDYRIGLIKRIGLAAVEALEADQTERKWTIEELKAIKAEYRAKLRELLKQREG